MSNISSNALFHFTSSAEYLIGILTNNFTPRYCYEEVPLNDEYDKGTIKASIPMVCFCDISLSQISNHIKTYGSYGIGMSKEWGIKNKLNPLIYVNEKSKLADSFSGLTEDLMAKLDDKADSWKLSLKFITILEFLKPYSGDFRRKDKLYKNFKFYDEREWRYIPNFTEHQDISPFLNAEESEDQIIIAKENNKLKKATLNFTPHDIKYIFVKNENEIHSMIEALREIKAPRFDNKTIDILISKILTTKQLGEDF